MVTRYRIYTVAQADCQTPYVFFNEPDKNPRVGVSISGLYTLFSDLKKEGEVNVEENTSRRKAPSGLSS